MLYVFPILSFIFLFLLIWLIKSKKGKGISGELVASYFLNKLDSSKYFIINDIALKVGDRTTQIDHIVVSEYGIFVIETKNWKITMYGGGRNIYKYVGGVKNTDDNPHIQNDYHIECLREVLTDYPNLLYISIVAFGGYTKLEIKDSSCIKISELLDTISGYKDKVISKEDVEGVYRRLKSLKKNDRGNRREHRGRVEN